MEEGLSANQAIRREVLGRRTTMFSSTSSAQTPMIFSVLLMSDEAVPDYPRSAMDRQPMTTTQWTSVERTSSGEVGQPRQWKKKMMEANLAFYLFFRLESIQRCISQQMRRALENLHDNRTAKKQPDCRGDKLRMFFGVAIDAGGTQLRTSRGDRLRHLT